MLPFVSSEKVSVPVSQLLFSHLLSTIALTEQRLIKVDPSQFNWHGSDVYRDFWQGIGCPIMTASPFFL
jgi:hypothetical protein